MYFKAKLALNQEKKYVYVSMYNLAQLKGHVHFAFPFGVQLLQARLRLYSRTKRLSV